MGTTRVDEVTSDTETVDRNGTGLRIQERTPRIIYAHNAQGNPVPLINVPLERIQELLDQADGVTDRVQPPRFQLNRLEVGGQADTDRAALDVQLTVTTVAEEESDTDWIAVPLRFHEAALLEPPTYEGAGQLLLVFDRTQGYVAWIQKPGQGEHQIRLRLDVALSHVAQTTQLRFYPPLANISRLSLTVPGRQISADLQNGQDLQVQAAESERWLLSARDLQNEVVLIWREGGRLVREQPVQLDVRGDVRVLIDGPGAMRAELALDLQSYNRPVETFVLRLPPHTTLVSGNAQGYEVSDLTDPDAEGRTDRQTVQISLQKPSTQARLQLTTQSTAEAAQLEQMNVANYEVIGALRQSGQVSLWASEDWLVDWSLGPSVRRVAGPDRVEGLEERKELATFEYFRQPCDLKVQVAPQGTRKEVEPQYRMRISEDRVSLEARLRYRIRGARESFLEFDRNDWELDDVGPAGEVEIDNYEGTTPSRIKLKLKRPASGELELVLQLHRRVTQRSGTLRFPLPWPTADTITGGQLTVSASPAMELDYRLQEMIGLVQDVLPEEPLPPQRPAESATPATAFRFRSDRALGDVVIDYEVRPQEITVRADTALELAADRADVQQQFTYRVRYQPAARLTLDFPRPLIDLLASPRYRSQIEFQIDGEPVAADALIDSALAVESPQPILPITVPLPQLRLGTIDVSLRYPWPFRSGSTEVETLIPLASPRDGRLVANTATFTPIGPLRVQAVQDGKWTSDTGAARSDALQTVLLSSNTRPNQIALRVSPPQETSRGSVPPGATLVRRAWIQTWLGRQQRLDRLVYRIATGAERVFLQLPPGVDLAKVVTLVDGVQVTALPAERELAIPLDRRPGGEHTLELSLPFSERPAQGWIDFPMPQLRDATPPQRWFWQLVLPSDEYLLVEDSNLTAAHRWVWSRWFWRRETSESQRTLEQWTSASSQPLLPQGAHQYLFSSFENQNQVRIYSCPRRLLVYGASATVLLLGLALLYLRWLRHPLVLLLLAVVAAGLAWQFPAAAVLLAQASVVGGILWLLALLIAVVLYPWRRSSAGWVYADETPSDTRSGVQSPWRDRNGVVSSTTAPAPTVPAMLPDSDL